MDTICKVKFIGDKQAKPFWATEDAVNEAIDLIKDFLSEYLFENGDWDARHRTFQLITKGFGVQAYQWKCGQDGNVVKWIFKPGVKKRFFQMPKRRRYNTKLAKYQAEGYQAVPRIKLEACKIKDQSGIHLKSVDDVAREMMRRIVCRYLVNTALCATLEEGFNLAISLKFAGDSERILIDISEIVMTLFEANLIYKRYLKDNLCMGNFPVIGFYTMNAVDTNGNSYHPKHECIGFHRYEDLHLFDIINSVKSQVETDGPFPMHFYISISLQEQFTPKEYLKSIKKEDDFL